MAGVRQARALWSHGLHLFGSRARPVCENLLARSRARRAAAGIPPPRAALDRDVEHMPVDVVVIGAGQAGLSAAYHLRGADSCRSTARPRPPRPSSCSTPTTAPGGAWQHRWASLKMATVNGIHELPGLPGAAGRCARVEPRRASAVLPRVRGRVRPRRAAARPGHRGAPRGRRRHTAGSWSRPIAGGWAARYVINATGTWTRPFWPHYPGQSRFRGRQLHVADYVSADEFAGKRVVIVGAGISAVQLLDEISHVAETFWVTRREPDWSEEAFDIPARVAAIAGVEDRVRRGLPPGSVISVTGHALDARGRARRRRGECWCGIRCSRRSRRTASACRTGRSSRPTSSSGRRDSGRRWTTSRPCGCGRPRAASAWPTRARLDEPRLFLIGYGPSQSTVGANRAGEAVRRS